MRFSGDLMEGYRACFESRIAMRILLEIATFDAPNETALYDAVRALDWAPFVTPKQTLAVRASSQKSTLEHTQYLSQLIKDAVVDQIRDRVGARPNVDLERPDVLISLHLASDVATLYVDLAAEPLFRRGYRVDHTGAPLKETLAAAILRLSQWDRRAPLYDPMCGSGTFMVEAALWAHDLPAPAALGERHFGFERWAGFDETSRRWTREFRQELAQRSNAPKERLTLVGSDIDQSAILAARQNAKRAHVDVRFERAAIHTFETHGPAWIITNPPYGERLSLIEEDEVGMGRALSKNREATLTVLAGGPSQLDGIALRPQKLHHLWNGDLECRLALYAPVRRGKS